MNVLQQIVAERRADVAEARERYPLAALEAEIPARRRYSLREGLTGPGTHIVAEVKQASPSAGLLRPAYDPAALARDYAAAGACGISVLTEPRHFKGSADHVRAVRRAVALPILRKDFICDPYHVAEAAAWGADVVLLIVAALDRATLTALYAKTLEYGLEVLVEAHSGSELEAALALPEALIGVNSRDLTTLRTDLAVARALATALPTGRLVIAESGIRSRAEVAELETLGYRGFLVGESILAAPDPAAQLRALRGVA